MPAQTEPMNLGDLLKYEAPNMYSRDVVTVAAPYNLSIGTVVGLSTENGELYALNPNALDGTNIPVGVLITNADATAADVEAVIVARHAIVASHALVWPAGITAAQQSDAIRQLKNLGILVREGV